MSIDSLGGINSAFDQQSLSSEMATKTDTTSGLGTGSSASATADKESFGAAVVSKTLDYMNSGGGSSEMSQTYEFSKNVLSGYVPEQGTLTDIKI